MRPENQRMGDFLAKQGINCKVKYIATGSLKGCWRLTAPEINWGWSDTGKGKWTEELQEQLTGLGFVGFDNRPLNRFSGNGGRFSVFVRGRHEFLEGSE